ncbi:DnaJ domain protein [Gregarina niphandrodes]|uniref:DnaJ domain protein n=1 Tax=Gregarina niphandrodes TaxID=110365 RepID=A0A023B3T1_GRENI|nr:DnaJ domain protein [Gregarina niphandrodes]EZG55908.1 DnaJ domain protein [Gregarina niphandrodes]|eukprot:XP_011131415.1 DnaJ domain protein [Gregarina niphandrodes]
MASSKHAVKRRVHLERATPAAKAKHGPLENRDQFLKRAKTLKKQQQTLNTLHKKAALRNPQEFNFKMISTRKEKGKLHIRSQLSALLWGSGQKEDSGRACRCSLCEKKRAMLEAESERPLWLRFLGTSSDRWQLLCIASLSVLFWFICTHFLSAMPSVASFNPWEILNITETASARDVKKAFRTMSLKFHPDKNPNDASAAAKFVLISKAYHTLTDEVAKKNFERFGNPDGRQGLMRVGIGLPTFMLEENYQLFILATFFIGLLVVVPGCFLLYYYHISRYVSHYGLHKETINMVSGTMQPKLTAHRVIAMLAASHEIRNAPAFDDYGRPRNGVREISVEEMDMLKTKCNGKEMDRMGTLNSKVMKACLLIYIYLARETPTLAPKFQHETRYILRKAVQVSRAMLDIAFINNWIPTIQAILAVRKCLFQAVEIGSLPVIQVPHIFNPSGRNKDEKLARARVLLNSVQQFKPSDFHALTQVALEHKETALQSLSPDEVQDVSCMFQVLPNIKFEGAVYVEDEKEICVGDIATCRLTITRQNLNDGDAQGDIHAPYFPDKRQEEWFVFIADKQTNELYGYKAVQDNQKVVEVLIQFPVLKPLQWTLTAVCLADCCFGSDRTVDIPFTAQLPEETDRQVFIHPDDVALDGQASLMQQILGTAANDEDEDENSPDAADEEPDESHLPEGEAPGHQHSDAEGRTEGGTEDGTEGETSGTSGVQQDDTTLKCTLKGDKLDGPERQVSATVT